MHRTRQRAGRAGSSSVALGGRGPALVVAAAIAAAGCDRGRSHDAASAPPASASASPAATAAPSTPAAAAPPPAAPSSAAPGCNLAPLPLRLPAARRLVAIGDLHGDLAGARAALRAAGAIDDRDLWIGGELVVVQTGDVLDRGDDERALLDLIAALETEARAAGGAYVQLLGNHELMNGAGDFRYVTPAGFHAFDGAADAAAPADVPPEARSRFAALGAGHSYAHQLARHAVIAIVGDTVFSHAGVLAGWAPRVDEVNRNARCWLDGQTAGVPVAMASDSPVWTRAYGGPAVDCAQLGAALAALQVKRMVVGHTVQERGITSACDGALWRIDVGLSRHYGGPTEVLEIVPGAPPKVLHGGK